MVQFSIAISTIACFTAMVSADFVKFDAKKLKGSWAQNADIEKIPIYAYYKHNLNSTSAINGTVAGLFNDKIYYAVDLALGSNAQNITVLVDTVSSDLWVNSIDNEVCAKGLMESELPPSNFTIFYEYTQSATISSPNKSSSLIHHTGLTTSFVTSYNSQSDVYYIDGHVSTDTTKTTKSTKFYSTTKSFDIHFYPSVSASTNWLSAYPHPTFALDNFEVLDYEPQNCSAWGLFNSSQSNSFITNNKSFEALPLNDEIITGIWAKDYVSYGNSLLQNFSFGLVNNSEYDSFGVLGLGLPTAESIYLQNGSTYESFPFQLKSSGFIKRVIYSIYDDYLTEGSSLLFGGINLKQFIGNLTIVPLIKIPVAYNDTRNASAIAITLSKIYFDNESNGKNETTLIASGLGAAIIDTGLSTAALPYYIHNEIVNAAGFEYSETLKAYVANYTELENKTITFNFQSVEINVPIVDLTFPLVDISTNEISDFVVFAVDATPDYYALGDAILQYLYVAIDLEDLEVAIAPKDFFPTTEHIVPVTSSFPNATTAPSYNQTYGYHGVTDLKLATVHNPNSISQTSFSVSYIPSVTAYSSTVAPKSSSV
jgi:hypothetical protein